MKPNIIIFDTTLRDGEQSPGAMMTQPEKIEIAMALDAMGVDVIEAGFAMASQGDFECVREIAKKIERASVCSLARAKKADIESAAAALKAAKKPRIHTFISTSDIHLKYQFRMSREEALSIIHETVCYARNFCDDVEWSAMDATRSDIDYLARAVEIAIKAGARTINIPDTVGYSLPHEFGNLIRTLREKVPNIDQAIISTHCHNDLGMAVANSIAGIEAGARQIECTINGIGERAGNAALEEIVMAINTRNDGLKYQTNINTTHISDISKMVSKASGFAVQKNKAIVGQNAFAHESGIHQDGMLKSRETYEIMRPESIGLKQSELVMGKHSGRAAFREKIKNLGISVPDFEFENFFTRLKSLGDRKKHISDQDIVGLMDDKKFQSIIPAEPKAEYIWVDGEFIPWKEAQTHILTHGLHYASAVFEGERAYNGKIFKLREHNVRLRHSAEMLGFKIPYSADELDEITKDLIQRNKLKNAYIRPIAWCGTETLSVASKTCRVHVAIAAWEWHSYFNAENLFAEGLKLAWSDWIRPAPNMAPVNAKASGLYMIGSLSKNKAEQDGFHDALMKDYRGYIAECTGANFFMVKQGEIHTPIADCFLDGITRRTIIDIARRHKINVIERHIKPEEIQNAEEIFITGSAVEVAPVGRIDKNYYTVGPISKMLSEEYQKLVST